MSIYDDWDIDPDEELRESRGKTYKVIRPSGTSRNILYAAGVPIHFISPSGYGENPSVEELQDIDKELHLESTPSGYDWSHHWTTSSNKFKIGFRSGNVLSKFQTIRPYINDDYRIDFTPYKAWTGPYMVLLPVFFNFTRLSGASRIIHRPSFPGGSPVSSLVELDTRVTNIRSRSYFKINWWLTDLRYQEIIELTGFEIVNDFVTSGNVKVYTPDSNDNFTIRLSSNTDYSVKLGHPRFESDTNLCPRQGVTHRLFEEADGTIIYEKSTTPSGNDWLLTQTPPYYIDADTYLNDSRDGWVGYTAIHADQQTSWDNCHDATTGSTTDDAGTDYFDAVEAVQSQPKDWQTNITRSFFYYSTEAITAGSTIVWASGVFIFDETVGGATVGFQEGTQATPLTTADYDAFTGDEIGTRGDTLGAGGTEQQMDIGFYNSGFSWIKMGAGATTKICMREAPHDIEDTQTGPFDYDAPFYYSEGTSHQSIKVEWTAAAAVSTHTYFITPQYSGTSHVALGWIWNSGCFNSASGMRSTSSDGATWEWGTISSSHLYFYPSGGPTGWIWVSGSYQGGGVA